MSSRVSFTVILLSFNHCDYVEEAIRSILSQTLLPDHLIIVDDCSQDSSVKLIEQTLHGDVPESVKIDLIVLSKNGGVCSALNACSPLISTKLVITAAADDISFPERLAVLSSLWISLGKPDALYSGAILINEKSEYCGEYNLLPRSRGTDVSNCQNSFLLPPFYGAGSCYSARIFQLFDPLPTNIRNEDFILMFRAWLLTGVAYSRNELIGYRQHSSNLSINRQLQLSSQFTVRCRLRLRGYWNYVKNLVHALHCAWKYPGPVPLCVYLVIIAEASKTFVRIMAIPLVEYCTLFRVR